MTTPTAKVSFPPRTKAAGPPAAPAASPVASVGAGAIARPVASSPGFAVNDQVEYFSTTLNQWIPCIITQVNGPHIMIDAKPGQWLGPADIQAKIRTPAAKSASPMGLRVGDKVEYWSSSMGRNLLVTVTAVGPTGDIMIDVRPGVWIGLEEQKQKIKIPAGHPAAKVVPSAVVTQVPRCPKGHPLIFTGNSTQLWCCNAASEEGGCTSGMSGDAESLEKSKEIPRFQCKYPDCDYDLCAPCAVSRSSPSTAVNPATCKKGHTLVSKGSGKSGWICDMTAKGTCLNGDITDYRATAGLVRYTCIGGCNFDLCEQCYKAGFQSAGVGEAMDRKLYCPALHNMTFQGKREAGNEGWICGAAREFAGCASGITEATKPGQFSRYRCTEGCDYSLCEKCAAPRFITSSATIAPAGPKVDFKAAKQEIKEPEAPSGDLPIGSIVLDPLHNLDKLPQEIFSGAHQHPLKLKLESEANPLNIWKRLVVHGNTCDECGTDGHTNYYRCKFDCKWYTCLECAKKAAVMPSTDPSPTSHMPPSEFGKPRFGDLTALQQDFYRQLEKVVSKDFKGDLGVVSPERIFAKYDKNKDKSIDREEMANVVGFIYKNIALDVPLGRERMVEMIFASHGLNPSDTVSGKIFEEMYKKICQRALASFNVMGKDDLAKRAKGEFRAKYELGKRLSAGVGGVTYLAKNKKSDATVVVKRPFKITNLEDFELLKDKSHPNIVRVFELFASQTETWIVMECCAGGDLFGTIDHCFENFGGMSYNFIAGIIRQALTGTNYLHKEFLECHNDLKPENVLLENKPKSLGDIPRAMIADFGEVSAQNAVGHGDPRYRAPEVWDRQDGTRGSVATVESDVWGLGVMFFELLSGGNLPFIKHRNLANWPSFIQYQGGRLARTLAQAMWTPNAQPDYTELAAAGPYAVDLCKGMLAYNRSDRISIPKALEHPYFDILKADLQPLDAKLAEVLKKRSDSSSLKIALLNFVASKMQGTSLDHFSEIWQQFDFKNEGVLREEVFTKMLVDKLGFNEAKAMEIFELADVDSSGAVDFNEFVGVLFDPTYIANEQLESHLQGVFLDLADTDGKMDFRAWVSIFPASHSRSVLQSVFSEMDKDNDGSVDWEEFKDCVALM